VAARWSVEAPVVALLVLAALAYVRGSRALAAGAEAAPTGRNAIAFGAGLGVVGVALISPIATYAEALLSVHMVQHLLLVLVAAPLLVAGRGGPVLAAAAPPDARRLLRAVGASPVGRLVTHPVTAWVVFAATGWVVHFSPLFDLALRHETVHAAEHALFLGAGLVFWQPVLGHRGISYPVRVLYLAVAMPQNTFLALAIYSAGHPLYPTYARLGRAWGPSVLADQRLGGGIMWVAGDLTLLVAVLAVAASWAGHEIDETGDEAADEAAEAAAEEGDERVSEG
jgi:putative copper resistance protein D